MQVSEMAIRRRSNRVPHSKSVAVFVSNGLCHGVLAHVGSSSVVSCSFITVSLLVLNNVVQLDILGCFVVVSQLNNNKLLSFV